MKMNRFRLLRGMLHGRGYNQPEVAELLGLSVSSVSNRYRGKTPWTLDEMYTLMDAVNADYAQMSELFPKGGIK